MCIIVDNKNIFIHVPKCAGTTVSSMINNKKISNFKLKKISNKMKRGHFGIYPLYINNLYNQPFFVPYKKYKLVKDDIKKYKYSHNHSDLNILLSERNIDEGLYVYWILFLITKINHI